jgi:N-acetylmuramoyl-L-alanine amidase
MTDPINANPESPTVQAILNYTQQTSRRRFIKLSALGIMGLVLGAYCTGRRWRYIVVHHSAGDFGNVAFLGKVHRQRQPCDPIDSMAYHFVVGNGKGLQMGRIDYGLRWRSGLWGAHVSARNNQYNLQGIGLCLIGNYHEYALPPVQYDALVALVRGLMKTYDISVSRVFAHGRIKGENTVCPGKYFPLERFYFDIA